MSQETTYRPVAYGNLRAPRAPGIFGVGLIPALALMLGLIVAVVAISLQFYIPGVILLALVLLFIAPWALGSRFGWNPYAAAANRLGFTRAAMKRDTTLVQHGLAHDGRMRMPGLLAATELWEAKDAFGQVYGLLHTPSSRHWSVTIECAPSGTSGVDDEQIDNLAANFGAWLAELNQEEDLVLASIVVESAPDTGHRLRSAAMAGVVEDSPEFSRQVLTEMVESAPTASASMRTFVCLTFSGRRGGKVLNAEAMAEELGPRLAGIRDGLRVTGAGPTRWMTAADLTDFARVAYDPSVASQVEELRQDGEGTGLDWEDAGPAHAETHYDYLVHDGSVSKTWTWNKPPRGVFHTLSLEALLQPNPKVSRKRVAVFYRPLGPERSGFAAEMRVNEAQGRVRQSTGNVSSRKEAEYAAAKANADAEAKGNPFIRASLAVTATVASRSDLPAAERTIKRLSGRARLNMRPANGSQDSMFAATLPFGVALHEHHSLPEFVREGM